MRQAAVLLFLCLCIGCFTTNKTKTVFNPINGTWIPIQQEFGGTTLPAAAFVNQKLILSDSNYTFIAESIDKGVVKYAHDKMDIYGKEGVNAGKHFKALYKFIQNTSGGEDTQLTVCYNLSGDSYPETFDTKGKPMYFLSIFKKEIAK